jgi:hypothetical protein
MTTDPPHYYSSRYPYSHASSFNRYPFYTLIPLYPLLSLHYNHSPAITISDGNSYYRYPLPMPGLVYKLYVNLFPDYGYSTSIHVPKLTIIDTYYFLSEKSKNFLFLSNFPYKSFVPPIVNSTPHLHPTSPYLYNFTHPYLTYTLHPILHTAYIERTLSNSTLNIIIIFLLPYSPKHHTTK